MLSTTTRTRNLALAGGLALVAGLLTLLALRGHGGTPAANAATKTKTVGVLVARTNLQVGTSIAQALAQKQVVVEQVDAESVEPGAVPNGTLVGGDVVLQPIYKGEQVTTQRLGKTGEAGLQAQISGHDRVMTVPGTADQLLAGIVQPGDHVDVVANIKLPNSDVHYTRVIVHDALVLRAPAAPSSGNAATGQLIATLQLSDAEAQRLYWAQENGNFALVLRPSTHPQGGSLKPQSAQTLLQKGV